MSISERETTSPPYFPSVNSYDIWSLRDFQDDFLLDNQQPLYLTPEEERLFKSFGDGLDSDLEKSFGSNDTFLDEKQAVYAEAHAAGLFKGGIRRAAFSMGDLQALQPTVPVSQASRSPPLSRGMPSGPGPLPSGPPAAKTRRLESVPESAALPNPPHEFGSGLMMESQMPERMSGDMLDGLQLDQDLEGPGSNPQFGSNSGLGIFSDNDPMRSSTDLGNLDLAMPMGPGIKGEPQAGPMTGVYPTSTQPLEFPGSSSAFGFTGEMEGLEGFNSRLDYPEGNFSAGSQMQTGSQIDNIFDFSYMDVAMGGADKRPPLAPRSPSATMNTTSSMPTLDTEIMASSQQTFKEIPTSTQTRSHSQRLPGRDSEAKPKSQPVEEKPSKRTSKALHRSQSALELRSMSKSSLPSHGSTGDLQKPRFTVELTTPEGHTYTAGRLSNEDRAQKILRYRQKRHERNFNKRIKYMCRKTLADSRPRVRGRFARNDDAAAVMPHETKKALAAKAKQERKAAEAAAAEYLLAQDRAAGRFPPNFMAGLSANPSLAGNISQNPTLSTPLDFSGSRQNLTSDLSDLVPSTIPHVDSDPNLSSGTAFSFPQMPLNSFPSGQEQHDPNKH